MGEIELMSITALPADSASATPSEPNRTFSTSGVSGTMMMTASASVATSRAVSQAVPFIPSGTPLRLCRNMVCPAAARCSAMGRPMMPSPINPTFMIVSP